jgi:hypothetical protein
MALVISATSRTARKPVTAVTTHRCGTPHSGSTCIDYSGYDDSDNNVCFGHIPTESATSLTDSALSSQIEPRLEHPNTTPRSRPDHEPFGSRPG